MTSPLNDENLIETLIEGQEVFSGRFLRVQRDFVRLPKSSTDLETSKPASREYIKHPGASMVVPLLDDGRVLIERQYRHPNRCIFTEFPAGKIDPGEPPLVTAFRELREETGYEAAEIAHFTTIHNAIAYSDEHIELYFARKLTHEGTQLDAGEFINTEAVTTEWLMNELREGRLTDVKTQIGLWWLVACQRGDIPWPTYVTTQGLQGRL
jgi:ADP-ribose pyrophosphatase